MFSEATIMYRCTLVENHCTTQQSWVSLSLCRLTSRCPPCPIENDIWQRSQKAYLGSLVPCYSEILTFPIFHVHTSSLFSRWFTNISFFLHFQLHKSARSCASVSHLSIFGCTCVCGVLTTTKSCWWQSLTAVSCSTEGWVRRQGCAERWDNIIFIASGLGRYRDQVWY